MTKTEIARRIHVMQAWLDGKQIQIENYSYAAGWRDVIEDEIPKFNFGVNEFRVKPEKKVAYMNIYPVPKGRGMHRTRRDADHYAAEDRVACVRVDYVEGQYDD